MNDVLLDTDGLTEEELGAVKKLVELAAGVYDSMLAMTGEKKTALWAANRVLSEGLGVNISLVERPRWEVKGE